MLLATVPSNISRLASAKRLVCDGKFQPLVHQAGDLSIVPNRKRERAGVNEIIVSMTCNTELSNEILFPVPIFPVSHNCV
jgi:hypothetical protein